MKKSSKIFTITLFSLFAILFNIVSGGGYTSLASATECGATYTVDNTTNTITLNKPTETEQQQTETSASCINQELENLDNNITINLNGQKIVGDPEEGIYTIYITKTVIIEDTPTSGIITKGEVDSTIRVGSYDDSAITGSLTIKSGIFNEDIRTYNQGTTLTVEDGEFNGPIYNDDNGRGGSMVIVGGRFYYAIIQGTYEGCIDGSSSDLTISGGEFMFNGDGESFMGLICGNTVISNGNFATTDTEQPIINVFVVPSMGYTPTLTITGGVFTSMGEINLGILTSSMADLKGKVSLQGGTFNKRIFVGSMTESDKDNISSDDIYNTLIPQDYGLFYTDTNNLAKEFQYIGEIQTFSTTYVWLSDAGLSVYKIASDDEDPIIPVPDTGAITKTSNDQVSSSTIVTAVLVGIVVAMTSACVLIKR